jgi:hypothetical protein
LNETSGYVHNPEVKTSIHVFDHTIKPILLYGCEIWGYFNPFTSRFRNGNIPIDQIFSNLHCEKLHLKFCKFLLGVHKKSTNFAVQSELGRFPLHFDILKQILRFWHRLENLDSSFSLLKAAYKCTKNLYESKQPSWYGSVQHILQNMRSLTNFLTDKISTFKYKCNTIVKQHYLT